MRDVLRRLVAAAIDATIADGLLDPSAAQAQFDVAEPPSPELGDFSTNAAMVLARHARRKPIEVAEMLLARLPEHEMVQGAEVAPPGFVNFRLRPAWLEKAVAECLAQGDAYGRSNVGAGLTVQVEFVSANPVGPIHIGNARGGPYGDVLASLFEATGHEVTREYYVNDGPENTQIKLFGQSIQARYMQLLGEDVPVPEGGYVAEYVVDIARRLLDKYGDSLKDIPRDENGGLHFFQLVRDWMVETLREDCTAMGISFDVWFSEQSLYDSGAIERAVAKLRELGVAYERDGAIWLRSSDFGDDEDRVLVRQSGAPTYLASDVAYAINKFIERGFDHVVYVWGPDHAGYIARLKAAVASLGIATDRCEVIIYQTVRFLRDGQPVRLSKRHGQAVPIREIVEEVGKDATRFFFLLRSVDAHLDFDIDLAKSQTEENPVYYVQYAHARIRSIEREAEARGFSLNGPADLSLLSDPAERELMRFIAEYPSLIVEATRQRAPHRLPHFAIAIARTFHKFYDRCRVLDPSAPDLSAARLALVRATGQVLRNLLGILGVSAPERM